jgi:DNA-binding NtrC family response regulator
MSRLLIVDDEMDIREFARNFFRKRNIEVFTASGGTEAFDIIQNENPDLVLLDVRMEEITGVELLRKVRDTGNDVKVIMVSGVEDESTIDEAKSMGVLGFIHKPLVLDELEKIVLKELQGIQA